MVAHFAFIAYAIIHSHIEIPFDDAAFRASRDGSYQRTLVTLLLDKGDLELSLEFCREFLIEGI